MSQDLHPVVERQVGAFNARDPDAFPWVEDIEFIAPGAALRGRDEVLGFMRGFWEAFPDAQLSVVRAVADGSRAAAEGRFSGTHTGALQTPSGEVPATDRPVEFGWLGMYEFAGDKLLSEHLYFDQAELLGQLGLMPG